MPTSRELVRRGVRVGASLAFAFAVAATPAFARPAVNESPSGDGSNFGIEPICTDFGPVLRVSYRREPGSVLDQERILTVRMEGMPRAYEIRSFGPKIEEDIPYVVHSSGTGDGVDENPLIEAAVFDVMNGLPNTLLAKRSIQSETCMIPSP